MELCQETIGCEYYTYDTADSACLIYEDCLRFDESCFTCTSGENECPPILCDVTGGCHGILVGRNNILVSSLSIFWALIQFSDRRVQIW